jgi:hypothetical protein
MLDLEKAPFLEAPAKLAIRRLIAEVRRLRAIIIGSRSDLHREAKAINAEREVK